MEQVMDSARRVNQVVGKGGNDGQAQSLWKALRASINDLARSLQPDPRRRLREGQTVPVTWARLLSVPRRRVSPSQNSNGFQLIAPLNSTSHYKVFGPAASSIRAATSFGLEANKGQSANVGSLTQ